ncbi:MAG: DEAD/DEAH box helicase [Dehalococcoidia bacterium]
MSYLETVKKLLGIGPVSIGELNRRATLKYEQTTPESGDNDFLEGIVISEEYEEVRQRLEDGAPVVFVTGNAGTGKTTLIRYIRTVLGNKRHMVVVAPTGVAALNIDGVTIHSFFQLPHRIHNDADIKKTFDRRLYQKLDLLIIDEISMVRSDLMDSIDKFLRKNRSDDRPFGGVQLLLVGDLFQLPPVTPQDEWDVLHSKGYASPYFFSAFSLQQSSLDLVELTYIYRQEDRDFVDLLNKVRIADDVERVIGELNRRCIDDLHLYPDIILTSTNHKADVINKVELDSINSREYSLEGVIQDKFKLEHDRLPSPFDLRLKIGAHVMFTKNDGQRRWVNGTLGIVRQVNDGSIRVQVGHKSNDVVCDVLPVTWETHKYTYDPEQDQIVALKIGEYRQFPLMLAWAVTIHKSQGKTLDNVLVDLGSGTFASGQLYVALSRCRSIEGLRLKRDIRPTDVKCDPVIKRFYSALEEMKNKTPDTV